MQSIPHDPANHRAYCPNQAEMLEHERSQTAARRAEWRLGFDVGVKVGAARFFQSAVIENIAVELATLRALVKVLAKRDEWYRRKLADAYHVILKPRR